MRGIIQGVSIRGFQGTASNEARDTPLTVSLFPSVLVGWDRTSTPEVQRETDFSAPSLEGAIRPIGHYMSMPPMPPGGIPP